MEHGGADVDAAGNGGGRTPLFEAACEGHLDVARLLVDRGADVNPALTDEGMRPLHAATEWGHMDVALLLLEGGATVVRTTADSMQFTESWDHLHQAILLHHAAQDGRLDIVRFLVDRGASANTRDDDEMTPAGHALSEGHLDVANYLIDRGGGVFTDFAFTEQLHGAADAGDLRAARFLVDHRGADVRAVDVDGWTPLHWAASQSHSDVAHFLLDRGARPDVGNDDGVTPIDLAAARCGGSALLFRMIRESGALVVLASKMVRRAAAAAG